MMEGWCPAEDIYSGVTDQHKVLQFYKAAIYLNSYINIYGTLYRNDKDIKIYPAEQANYFDMDVLIKSFGFSQNSLYDIGGIVRLVSHFDCDKFPFMEMSKFWVI